MLRPVSVAWTHQAKRAVRAGAAARGQHCSAGDALRPPALTLLAGSEVSFTLLLLLVTLYCQKRSALLEAMQGLFAGLLGCPVPQWFQG
jgi:hypothetical protein